MTTATETLLHHIATVAAEQGITIRTADGESTKGKFDTVFTDGMPCESPCTACSSKIVTRSLSAAYPFSSNHWATFGVAGLALEHPVEEQ
jgi:hypothetical protein